ncbi:MAG: DUF2244 domain-containing protein [Rhodospirillales bacterium]|nr:DUF2244 domain-containing protein [Rhodospirillales bacterium]
MADISPPPPVLDLVLRPHRSLSPAGFWIVMGILAVWSFAGGIVFWSIGAWPVIGFAGLDFALVYWAFRASYASARLYERLRLSEDELVVERVHPSGDGETFVFQPYWLRVEIDARPEHPSRLILASHGRTLTVGAFLPPSERTALAATLRDALGRLRRTPVPVP